MLQTYDGSIYFSYDVFHSMFGKWEKATNSTQINNMGTNMNKFKSCVTLHETTRVGRIWPEKKESTTEITGKQIKEKLNLPDKIYTGVFSYADSYTDSHCIKDNSRYLKMRIYSYEPVQGWTEKKGKNENCKFFR